MRDTDFLPLIILLTVVGLFSYGVYVELKHPCIEYQTQMVTETECARWDYERTEKICMRWKTVTRPEQICTKRKP